MALPYMNSRSPPPLQHPKPTHPAYPPPEPPHTPGRSSASSPYSQTGRLSMEADGYTRYSSPPVGVDQHSQQQYHGNPQAHPQQQHQQQQPHASSSSYAPATGQMGGQGGGAHARGGYGASGPNAPMGYGGGPAGFGSWPGMNDATTQMGVQFGRSAVAAGHDYMEKNITRYLPLPLVKTCFSVTNGYVLNKLRLVLFPWRHRPWARQVRRSADGNSDGWQPPRDDINAPDLYIPTMALVTYTLLFALARGLSSRFKPEVLGESLSMAIAVVVVEFLIVKLGCYFLDVRGGGGASSVELLAYGGYKFVGIVATIVVSIFDLGWLVHVVFLYTFCANAFFLLRSLKYVLLPDPASAMNAGAAILNHAQRTRRVQFLFGVAMLQAVWMWWLSRVG